MTGVSIHKDADTIGFTTENDLNTKGLGEALGGRTESPVIWGNDFLVQPSAEFFAGTHSVSIACSFSFFFKALTNAKITLG